MSKNERNTLFEIVASETSIIIMIVLLALANIVEVIPFGDKAKEIVKDETEEIMETENKEIMITDIIKKIAKEAIPFLFLTTVVQLIVLCKNNNIKINEMYGHSQNYNELNSKIKDIHDRSGNNSELILKIDKVLSSVDSKLHGNVLFEENKEKADAKIKELIYDGKVTGMKIICYGAGLMGDIITKVITYNESHPDKVNLEVVICSPHPQNINFDIDSEDKNKLEMAQEKLKNSPNIKVIISEVIPTVRTCIVKGHNDVPIYCYYQPYYFYPSSYSHTYDFVPEKTLLHAQGFSPIITADENDDILKDLTDSCELEFERLKKCTDTGAKS